ncbi:MAG: hypothetical protein QW175_05080 [Candidatus Bathyarchaeia archaeon]
MAKSNLDELKKYREAKTVKEMVECWAGVLGDKADVLHKIYKVFEERAPQVSLDLIKTFIHDPEMHMMERGILDPKAKELAKLTIAILMVNPTRVTIQVVATKARGATDEEIMETVWNALYGSVKVFLGDVVPKVQQGFELIKQAKTLEKLEAARKEGKGFVVDPSKELELYRAAKTEEEIVASWFVPAGLSFEEALMEVKKDGGPGQSFIALGKLAPQLNIIKELIHDPYIRAMERILKGPMERRSWEYNSFVLVTLKQFAEAIMAHVGFMTGMAGATKEEIIELLYLIFAEIYKNVLERIAPALAEGFRLADELGYK